MAISEQEWKDWGEGKPKKMTIDEIKRALVEVRDICKGRRFCCEPEMCPFWNTKVFGCAIDRRLFPHEWFIDDWKEDSNATD